MKLVEFLDERGLTYIVNIEAICELEAAGEEKTRFYMVTHACRAHAVVMLTTPDEVATLAALEDQFSVVYSAAVESKREQDAEDAVAAKIAD